MKLITSTLIFLIAFQIDGYSKYEEIFINDSIPTQKNINSDKQSFTKVFYLKNGFKIKAGHEENYGKFKTFTLFQLFKNNKIIFIDSSSTEYEFGDTLYPIVIKTERNNYELLFEINDRPNKNYLKRLIIKDDVVVSEDKLPTFISKPFDVNGDRLIEYAGFWNYSETWGENNGLTDYNPILYYRLTSSGLKLDSALTKQRNISIYSDFKGYRFNEKIVMPASVINKFNNEITRIEKKQ